MAQRAERSFFFYLIYLFHPRPMPIRVSPPGGGGGGAFIPGAPTPCIGAAPSPIGTPEGGGSVTPEPLPRLATGMAPALLTDGGGGPSTAKLTTFSPRTKTSPRLLLSVRSSSKDAPLFLRIRNSSASLRTRFKCLSKARKVPTIDLPSCSVTRSRCSTYRNNLLPFPLGCDNFNHNKEDHKHEEYDSGWYFFFSCILPQTITI